MARTPSRPPLDGLKRTLERHRAGGIKLPRDGFLRETYSLPRNDARLKAREWFDRWPKQAYWTTIESWREKPGDVIEFTMRRLPIRGERLRATAASLPTFRSQPTSPG